MKYVKYLYYASLLSCTLLTGCKDRAPEGNQAVPPPSAADSVRQQPVNIQKEMAGADTARHGIAARVRQTLTGLFGKDLEKMTVEDRQFTFHAVDLNGDRKHEIFVGFNGPFHCGRGGCTALLIDHRGRVVTKFTVTEYPILVLPSLSKGWHDLVIGTAAARPAMRLVKWTGKHYPGNPVTQPEYAAVPPATIKEVFDFKDYEEQWHSF